MGSSERVTSEVGSSEVGSSGRHKLVTSVSPLRNTATQPLHGSTMHFAAGTAGHFAERQGLLKHSGQEPAAHAHDTADRRNTASTTRLAITLASEQLTASDGESSTGSLHFCSKSAAVYICQRSGA